MFENSVFDEEIITFENGDKFYFFTDGLDSLFDNSSILKDFSDCKNIKTLKSYINGYFLLDLRDCTFIDSTGLGVLVSVYKKCLEAKGSIKM